MMFLQSRILVPMAALAALGTSALAQAGQSESLFIHHAWSRETAAGQSVGGGFMTIANRGAAADRLLSGTSPVATEVQLHTMTMDGGIMRMRRVEGGIAVPARGTLELKPGSYHIMFMGLTRQLRQGERFPVTLRFQRAGNVTVQVSVQPVTSSGPMDSGHAEH
jgi:copper(I)-binding protein